ncbi:MAG: SET domain-containing protein-lysine N-methyltransferase, partial [Nitrososphaeraceae archaeon]
KHSDLYLKLGEFGKYVIYTKSVIPANEFVMEYLGEIISAEEADKRLIEYNKDLQVQGYYMLYVTDQELKLAIDCIPQTIGDSLVMKYGFTPFIHHSSQYKTVYPMIKVTKDNKYRIKLYSNKFLGPDTPILFDFGKRVIVLREKENKFHPESSIHHIEIIGKSIKTRLPIGLNNVHPVVNQPNQLADEARQEAKEYEEKVQEEFIPPIVDLPNMYSNFAFELTESDDINLIQSIVNEQHYDPAWKAIIDYLTINAVPADREVAKRLKNECKYYIYINKKLYFLNDRKYLNKTTIPLPRLVVPLRLRQDVLKQYHASPLGAHLGPNRCYTKLARKYYWPGMYKTMKE